MASAFTAFLSSLSQLVSLSIRFDSEPFSELVTRDFLTKCHMPRLTRFRLEMAWVDDVPESYPLLDFIRNNAQIRHLHFDCVDLNDGCWSMLLETLRVERKSLHSVEIRNPSEDASMVLFNGNTFVHIQGSEDMSTSLIEAQQSISVVIKGHDQNSIARYELYPDDTDYDE